MYKVFFIPKSSYSRRINIKSQLAGSSVLALLDKHRGAGFNTRGGVEVTISIVTVQNH